ncbi:MAG: cyclodeaminase/cyclohydrolase family protein [Sedimentisphaerales bacterium]
MYLEGKFKEYIDDLAAKKPAPGGGSAAAVVGALGVSLLSMVANFTLGKEKYKNVEPEIQEILSSSEKLRAGLEKLVDEDVAAYRTVSAAYQMAKETEEQKKARTEAIQAALRTAMAVPLAACRNLSEAMKLCQPLLEKGNANLASDVGVGAEFIASAFTSALLNVEINLASINDSDLVTKLRQELSKKEKEIQIIRKKVVNETKEKL